MQSKKEKRPDRLAGWCLQRKLVALMCCIGLGFTHRAAMARWVKCPHRKCSHLPLTRREHVLKGGSSAGGGECERGDSSTV